MSVTFTRTREQLRSMVLRKLGVMGSATSVASADADIVYEAIDLRLKELHKKGILWRKVDKVPASFAITAGIVSAHRVQELLKVRQTLLGWIDRAHDHRGSGTARRVRP